MELAPARVGFRFFRLGYRRGVAMNVKPLGDRIVVRRSASQEKTAGGEDGSGAVEVTGAGDSQESGSHQPQQRELEEFLHGGCGTRHIR